MTQGDIINGFAALRDNQPQKAIGLRLKDRNANRLPLGFIGEKFADKCPVVTMSETRTKAA